MTPPVNKAALPLEPEPESVRAARGWVTGILQELGREDLVEAAQLGVSELVTNAILHGEPPILVRVRGTHEHPRIEVHDNSPSPPAVGETMTEEDRLLTTVGRGLGIVTFYSTTWGAEVSAPGKVVWFEPAAEPRAVGVPPIDLEIVGDHDATDEAGEQIVVQLLEMPVQVFARFRIWFLELRRELRLLALVHGADYPVAKELSDLTEQLEEERRNPFGIEALDSAIAEGVDRLNLDHAVSATAPTTMARLLDILERADQFCREQRLLSLAGTAQQQSLQRWYLGEFIRQGAGEAPTPWPGEFSIEEPRT